MGVDADADPGRPIAEGQRALADGRWAAARDAFEAALDGDDCADALLGLGDALWWLGETERSVRCQERAYAAFRRRDDPAQAAFTAISLALTYRASLGNEAASRGWLGRAGTLVEEADLEPMRGWLLLCRAAGANDDGDPGTAERLAREALRLAREAADPDLELCALSETGTALVGAGRVDDGIALLDEAMAAALAGEAQSLSTVVLACCRTITSCSQGGQVKRAVEWIHAADEFNRRYGSPHLYTTCRVHLGTLLVAGGRWAQAEAELQEALRIGRSAEPALHAEALAALAQLRLAQGRLGEAARLLAGHEHHPAAVSAVAALRLAAGEPEVAAALVHRHLDQAGEDRVALAPALELLGEAAVALADSADAAAAAQRLATLGAQPGAQVVAARADRVRGRAALAAGDHRAAVTALERALATFAAAHMTYEAARTRTLLARALTAAKPAAAIAEGRAALEALQELGAAREADLAAGFLRSLGVRAARGGPRGTDVLTAREREVLALLGEGLSNPAIAERLVVSRKTVEHHVAHILSKLGLASRGEATAYAVRHLGGDAAPGPATK